MTDFERNVIERLTRLEHRIVGVEKSLKGFKTKVATVATALGAFVAGAVSYLLKG